MASSLYLSSINPEPDREDLTFLFRVIIPIPIHTSPQKIKTVLIIKLKKEVPPQPLAFQIEFQQTNLWNWSIALQSLLSTYLGGPCFGPFRGRGLL